MRFRLVSTLIVLAVVITAVLAAVVTSPASSTPAKNSVCTTCHSGTPSGTVTAVSSTTAPAAGATYTVAISIGLTASGSTGYHIAQTDVSGAATTWTTVSAGGPGSSQTSWTATMAAPSAPGTYYYKVWTVKGPDNGTGMAKSAGYSITVPGSVPTAAISSLTPNHGLTGSSVVIAGTSLGSGGTVRFGTTVATATSWSATSVTATVPATLAPGAVNVTVTPTSGAASNALGYTVDAPAGGSDITAPVTTSSGAADDGWYNHALGILLTATDNAGGSGVASITYSVDGGAPVTVGGATATVTLKAGRDGKGDADDDEVDIGVSQGPHSVTYSATDVAGNVEIAHTLTVNIDTGKPWTRAPRAAKVKRFHKVTMAYSVGDAEPNGATAKVRIAVKNRRGDVVKVLDLGSKPVNTPLTATFMCKLRTGVYSFTVKATDLAGNTQATAATRTLTVYRGS